ncbi:hypothetical protein F2Q70_00029289 [Brassica cretica]|uniref:Uncharacterized protein n=1 Tax=Brassica cretica TaxID=69181 RepID=A0A8S9FIX6_BRACR|nr:hypothetical protein F2Q70_00029289 [Brassica cretica]
MIDGVQQISEKEKTILHLASRAAAGGTISRITPSFSPLLLCFTDRLSPLSKCDGKTKICITIYRIVISGEIKEGRGL